MNISTKQKQIGIEKRFVVAKGEGWTGSLGLADTSYYM